MSPAVVIRDANDTDAVAISELILPVAAAQIASEFGRRGRRTFLGDLRPAVILGRLRSGYWYRLAEIDGRLIGLIATRGYSHVYHLFVERGAQGSGIGRNLWQTARHASERAAGIVEFTVFSSRYAEGFYRRVGFERTGDERTRRGVTAIPMRRPVGKDKQTTRP